jgi:UDP-N-acetylmuramate--alanine ligase
MSNADLNRSTHFIGIGGTGLSAIARVLVERGETVTGSDREDSSLAAGLRKAGVKVTIGHAAGNVNGATLVVRSSAVADDNVEVKAARAKGIPVYKRVDFLDKLLANQQVIAVAGSHGKTTTTAMLAWMLTALNQQPGYIIGSVAENLGTNAAAGAGRLFVIEADEYDHMFLGLSPMIELVTNVEHDHPDLFPTPEDFEVAFRRFADRLQPNGTLIACADDPGASKLAAYAKTKAKKVLTYAHSHIDADYQMTGLNSESGKGFSFTGVRGARELAQVSLQVPGAHNALNALGALAVADQLGLNLSEAAMALADFRGTGRRFEVHGEVAGILMVDDYAHHPTEIRSTLAAAKARYPGRRIWALWQPHTFSRILTLQNDFAAAFTDADRVLVTDVYAAREQRPANFEMGNVVKTIQHPDARFVLDFAAAKKILLAELQTGDVLIIMSAGDAINLSADLFAELKRKEQNHA